MRIIRVIFALWMSGIYCLAYPITDDNLPSYWNKLDSVFWSNYKPNPFPLDSISIDSLKRNCEMEYQTLMKNASVCNISSWSDSDRETYLVNKAKWVFLTVASDFYRNYSQPKIIKDSINIGSMEQKTACYRVLFPNDPQKDDIISPSVRTESHLFCIWIPENIDNHGFLYFVGPYEIGFGSLNPDEVLNKRFRYVTGREVGPKVIIQGKPFWWIGVYIPKMFCQ